MLSADEQAYRRGKFTGSLAPPVMTLTSAAELNHLARVKAELEPPDPENYQMRLGSWMEPFMRRELELETGHPVTRVGEIVDHPTVPNICVKLDGYRAFDDSVIEFKFLAPWRRRDEFFPYYYWQVLLQMLCCGASRGMLVVGQGTSPPIEHEVSYDKTCAEALIERATAFMLCVKTGADPCPLPPLVPPDKMRAIDITKESTNWGEELLAFLTQYTATKPYAEANELAGKAARALIPDDVNKVHAGRWQLARDKRGAIRITHKDAKEAA
jgi:predicted phage-related endonuclease